jgi:pilus assembly protein CpaB
VANERLPLAGDVQACVDLAPDLPVPPAARYRFRICGAITSGMLRCSHHRLGLAVTPGNTNSITQTILQDVEVLTAGEKIEPDPQGKAQTVNVVTLLLAPEESQKLLLASTQGSIQFVLRNGVDEAKTSVGPTSLNQLLPRAKGTPPPPPAPKSVNIPAPTSAATEPDGLEIIRGNTRTVEKF